MPVSAIPAIVPLSSYWTPQLVISEVAVLVNELDNERIQNANLRSHCNLAITHIAELLNMAQEPWYEVIWQIALESTLHFNGCPWVNLETVVTPTAASGNVGQRAPQIPSTIRYNNGGTPGTTVVPSILLRMVNRISAAKSAAQVTANNPWVWTGNLRKLSMNELTEQMNKQFNTQYRQSMCWSQSGNGIFLLRGDSIDTATGLETDKDYVSPGQLILYGQRKPMLDDLQGENQPGSGFRQLIDLPDQHVRLLVLMVQKMALEQLSKAVPPDLDGQVTELTKQITANLVGEAQFAQAERVKASQGFTNR